MESMNEVLNKTGVSLPDGIAKKMKQAMKIYAEQEAIAFDNWKRSNCILEMNGKYWIYKSIHYYNSSELYTIFKTTKQTNDNAPSTDKNS